MKTIRKVTLQSIFRNILMVALLFVSVTFASAQSADDDFSGEWKTNQGPIVQITKTGDIFKGINVEHDKLVLDDLKFEDGKWTGILIKPQDGSKYDCTAVLKGNKLLFTGKKGLISKTITWTKQ